MSKPLIKHNPAFLSKEELIESFVVRGAELKIILRCVRDNTNTVNQHLLVIAPRGMGKTMLMRRVSFAVDDDKELSKRWYPIRLAEENYGVATEGELWLEVLRSLARKSEDGKWQSIYEALETVRDQEQLRSQALARLCEFADEKDRRLLIIIENMNMLMDDQATDDAAWDMRKTLLNEKRIMLLTTATTHFDEVKNTDKAMYDLFRELRLEPLKTQECRRMWKAVTGEDLLKDRVRPMEILTGGNPRLLTILASFAAGKSFRQLIEDLHVLIDDHTTYFKSNIETLSPQERRIFAMLAEIWEPASARAVAEKSRMDVSKASAVLLNLVNRGAVSEAYKKGRKKFYQVTERLYNIYHAMRQSSSSEERARAVVEFMIRFYDLEETARCIAEEALQFDPADRSDHCAAYRHLFKKHHEDKAAIKRLISATPKEMFELEEMREVYNQYGSTNEPATLGLESKEIRELAKSAADLIGKGYDLYKQSKYEEAISVYDDVLERFGERQETPIAERVAMALVNKGITLERLNRLEKAIQVYDVVFKRFGERLEVPIAEQASTALICKAALLALLNRLTEMIQVCDEVLERFGERTEASIAKNVVIALYNKAVTLGQLNRPGEEIQVYDEVIERYSKRPEAAIAEFVAMALYNKGWRLGSLNRPEEEIQVFDEVIERFGERTEAPIAELVAMAFINKGVSLGQLDRMEEAIQVFDEAIERFGKRSEVPIAEKVAMAFVNKGMRLGELNRSEEAIQVYDEVIERFGERTEAPIAEIVAKATNGFAWVVYCSGKYDLLPRAVEYAQTAVERFPNDKTFSHTLACVLGMVEQWDKALGLSNSFLDDDNFIEKFLQDIIQFFVDAAAAGQAAQSLEVLEKSPHAGKFEPLVVGLKMMLEKEYRAPQEVVEVAKDVVKRIKERRKHLKAQKVKRKKKSTNK